MFMLLCNEDTESSEKCRLCISREEIQKYAQWSMVKYQKYIKICASVSSNSITLFSQFFSFSQGFEFAKQASMKKASKNIWANIENKMLTNEQLVTIQQVLHSYDEHEEIPKDVADAFKLIVGNEVEIIRAVVVYNKQFEELAENNTETCEDFMCLEALKTLKDMIATFLQNAGIIFTVNVNGFTIITFPEPRQ